MTNEHEIRQELAKVEADLAKLIAATAEQMSKVHRVVAALEGKRDQLLLKLTDLEGAHDKRYAGVR